MKRLTKLFLLPLMGLIFSCSAKYLDNTSQKVHKKYIKETAGALFVAQSKDKKYYFIGEQNNHFGYWISREIELPKKFSHYYAGEYKIKQDTMFLTYYENHFPSELSNYIIKDSSGRFLYQKLNDTTQLTMTIKYKGKK